MMPSSLAVLEWLIISGLLICGLLVLLRGVRHWLITRQQSRCVVLNLWWSIPAGMCLMLCSAQLISQQLIEAPLTLNVSLDMTDQSAGGHSLNWPWLIFSLWFLIAGVKTIRLVVGYRRLTGRIRRHSVRMAPGIYQCSLAITPMAMGLFRPVVVLPEHLADTLNQQQWQLVLLHEQIHCDRYDPAWRLLMAVLSAWYWFLPIRTLMGSALIEDQEYACDELVVQKTNDKAGYAKLLLGLSHLSDTNHSGLVCSSSFNLKDRIMKLNVTNQAHIHWPMIGTFILLVLLTGSVPALADIRSQGHDALKLVPVHTVAPKYPLKAYQQKLTGEVVVSFMVNQQGQVEDVEVVESSQGAVFNQAAIAAVSQWTFEPINQAKKAQQTLKFNLD